MGDFFGSLVSGLGDVVGGLIGSSSQEQTAQQNIAAQREFAQNGISWKVADAKRAGINPLYALGAPTTAFENVTGSNDLGEGISKAGQDIGRAAMASASRPSKLDVLNEHLLEAKIAGANQDVIHSQLINSMLARKFSGAEASTASPGDFMGPRQGAVEGPTSVDYIGPDGSISRVPTKEFSQSTMTAAAAPASWLAGVGNFISSPNEYDTYAASVRPDYTRAFHDLSGVFSPVAP